MVVFFVMRGIQEVLGLYMVTYFWELDANQITAVFIAPLPGLIVGVPFWTWAARRIDKKPTFIAG